MESKYLDYRILDQKVKLKTGVPKCLVRNFAFNRLNVHRLFDQEILRTPVFK